MTLIVGLTKRFEGEGRTHCSGCGRRLRADGRLKREGARRLTLEVRYLGHGDTCERRGVAPDMDALGRMAPDPAYA